MMSATAVVLACAVVALAAVAALMWRARERAITERDDATRISELANDAVLVADVVHGRILEANQSACRLLGYERAALLERNLPELHPPELVDRSAEIIADAWEKKGLVYDDLPFVRGDGKRVEVEVSANVIDFRERPVFLVYARDIGERRKLERDRAEAEARVRTYAADLEHTNSELRDAQAQLVQSEKMAALGTLVAGVAHELNTPIGAIHSNADMSGRAIETVRAAVTTEKARAAIEGSVRVERALTILAEANGVTRDASQRVSAIVKSLRNFARLDEADRKRVDVHEGLDSTVTLLRHELKGRIDVITDYGKLPDIECFPNRLNQVFMNVLVNAIHSIEGRGTITIRTRHEGERVLIAFEDTGKGIAPENLARIFDPGFTTKGVGVGTGLGLSICYRIMQDHQGAIRVESEVGKGTTFTLDLPAR